MALAAVAHEATADQVFANGEPALCLWHYVIERRAAAELIAAVSALIVPSQVDLITSGSTSNQAGLVDVMLLHAAAAVARTVANRTYSSPMTYILDLGPWHVGPFATHVAAEHWAETHGCDDYRMIPVDDPAEAPARVYRMRDQPFDAVTPRSAL